MIRKHDSLGRVFSVALLLGALGAVRAETRDPNGGICPKAPKHEGCPNECPAVPCLSVLIDVPAEPPVKPTEPRKPVYVPGGGGLYIIGKTDGITPPKAPPPVNCNDESVDEVVLYVYRDTPYWTKPLEDWSGGGTPRSPKYVFGRKRPISVEIHALRDVPEMDVWVTNADNGESLGITCKNAGWSKKHAGYHVYRHAESDALYLAGQTSKEKEKTIKVVEEEVLEFEVRGIGYTKKTYMVDRGEYATVTADCGDDSENKGLEGPAGYFWRQASEFSPFTTSWWSAGSAIRAINPAPFIRAAGSGFLNTREADLLYIGAHGNYETTLVGRGPALFVPSADQLIIKPGAAHAKNGDDQFTHPEEFAYIEGLEHSCAKFEEGDWGKDLDWAVMVSCYQLSDKTFETGKLVGTGKDRRFEPSGKRLAPWQRWLPAFKGERRLHGLLGFSGGARYVAVSEWIDDLRKMIKAWNKKVDAGEPFAKAWLEVGIAYKQPVAVLVIPRNFTDTKDTMQPDPANGDEPVRLDTGMDEKTLKKILGDGNYRAGQTLGGEAK